MKRYIAAVALVATSVYTYAQDVNKLINETEVARVIQTLSADDMQGRATFTPGIDKAATFIEGEFKKAGLQPLKGATGFRQSFAMTRTTLTKAQAQINGEDVPAANVVASSAASFNWPAGSDVQVVNITADKNFQSEYMGAMRSGKNSLIVIDPAFEANFKRLSNRLRQGTVSNTANANPTSTVFVLGKYAEVKSFTASADIKKEDAPLFNVAGMIPGKSKAEEFVVFSGHYDHLGVGKAMNGDSIFNGADDDASGTTAVIELAKYYKKLKNNERTLIFVAFTAEEVGGFGSQYFSKQLDPEKVVAMFNIEMIGKVSKFGSNSAFITGYERSDFGEILQKNLQGTAFQFHPDPYPQQQLFYRSDNATLAALGVPAHTISTDQIDIDPDYHKVTDELKTLDVANITSTIRAIALSSRSIVAGKDTPKRIPKLEPRR